MEVRQGIRRESEVQGGEIHLGGGAAMRGVLKKTAFVIPGFLLSDICYSVLSLLGFKWCPGGRR